MLTEYVQLIAQVRPTETWTAGSIVAGVVLFAVGVAALVAWAVRVSSRR